MQQVDPRSNTDFSVENIKGDPSFDTFTQDQNRTIATKIIS